MKMTLQAIVARRDKVNLAARQKLGERVKSVEELAFYANMRRSVVCMNCWGLLPARVVMNMAASCVLCEIQGKRIYLYNK